MRKLLMILVLGAALVCPLPSQAEDAPAPDQPAVTAPAEAPAEAPKPEKKPIVTLDEAKEAGKKIVEGVKEILKAPKTGDWKQDYLYPLIGLILTALMGLVGVAGLRHGLPYLKAKAAKAGIELDEAKERQIGDIFKDAVVLVEAKALKKFKKKGNETSSEQKATEAKTNIKKRVAVLGIDLLEDFVTSKLEDTHAVLSADPTSPVNVSGR